MPIFHGNALMGALGPCLANGAAFAMRRRFSASGFLSDIRGFGATFFNYVGRSLAYVLAQPVRPEEADNRAALRLRHRGLGPRSRRVLAAIRVPAAGVLRLFRGHLLHHPHARTRPTARSAFRSRDLTWTSSAPVAKSARRPVSMRAASWSTPRKQSARSCHAEPRRASRATTRIRPPAEQRLRDGDFWTGDLGYRDEHGFFWFAGRTADWLRVDSENFAAAPVERILSRFPGVTAAAVYPVPDPVTGDQVMAALEVPVGDFDAGAFWRLPRRATRPRHQVGAATGPDHRSPAADCHPQDQQADPASPAVERRESGL